ncbi:MAG TPA: succinate dehydrogenase, cytochrome b556 subunit [Arenimonas sp.]|nr:succinate dehydrogenase, cytochrome b556 subunit [Arenimonas sp.]
MTTNNRPLSPHLQVYRRQITMVMSISHRMTGVALAIGSLALLWVLVSFSIGAEAFATTQACLKSPLGQLALLLFSASLMYHLFNGIRHLFWDMGKGYAISSLYRSGYTVLALTVLSTLGIWYLATLPGAMP